MTPTSYVVTLIHGTFASKAAWVKRGSPLCMSLAQSLEVPIIFKTFAWAGANRHAQGTEAGQRLAAQLARQLEEAPDAAHFVVAHSHGGNIALYAMKEEPRVAERLRGVICLNTPFVAITRRSPGQLLFWLYHLGAWVGLIFGTTALLLCALWAFTDFASLGKLGMPQDWPTALTWLVAALSALAISACLIAFRTQIARWIVERQDWLVGTEGLPDLNSPRVLSLRTAGDEVLSLFLILDGLSSIPVILLHPLFVLCLVVGGFIWLLPHGNNAMAVVENLAPQIVGLVIYMILPLALVADYVGWKLSVSVVPAMPIATATMTLSHRS